MSKGILRTLINILPPSSKEKGRLAQELRRAQRERDEALAKCECAEGKIGKISVTLQNERDEARAQIKAAKFQAIRIGDVWWHRDHGEVVVIGYPIAPGTRLTRAESRKVWLHQDAIERGEWLFVRRGCETKEDDR